jgi:hypothetical protein
MTNVNDLHEFIKENPNILDKNTTQHITINKIYTDKNGVNIHKDDDNYEIEYKENSKKKNKNKIKIKKNISNSTESDSESEDSDGYVAKHEIEIEELDKANRFLKLDLNNEKVKSTQLESQVKTLTEKIKKNDSTISYVKECLEFMEIKNVIFETTFNFENITEYNNKIIDAARIFFKLEREYNKIKAFDNIDDDIKKSFDQTVTKKFTELKKSYDLMNNSLQTISNTMKYMKLFVFVMFVLNILMFIYNKF